MVTYFADFRLHLEIHEVEFGVIEDIYKCPLKLRHYDHLID